MKHSAELNQIRNEACVSIIIPVCPECSDEKTIEIEVKKAIAEAKGFLKEKFPVAVTSLLSQLHTVLNTIDYSELKKGIGIYVSSMKTLVIKFPFVVEKKVVVKDSFDLKELIAFDDYSKVYYILQLDELTAKLYKGMLDEIEEVKDAVFPAASKEFPKDFLLETDKKLREYLSFDNLLLLSGSEKSISLFEDISRHERNIIGVIKNFSSISELAQLAWQKVYRYSEEKKLNLIKKFEEKKVEGLGIEGIIPVWEAAKAGRGWKLLLEEGFPATLLMNGINSCCEKARSLTDRDVPAIVDDIIETVLEKKGEVVIYGNGNLKNHQHIALIKRFEHVKSRYRIL